MILGLIMHNYLRVIVGQGKCEGACLALRLNPLSYRCCRRERVMTHFSKLPELLINYRNHWGEVCEMVWDFLRFYQLFCRKSRT